MLKVCLSTPEGRRVGRYFNVDFRGQLLLTDIIGDPAKQIARALLKTGFTGLVAIVAENGSRSVIDIEKAAGGKWRPLLERNTKRQGAPPYE